MWLQSFGLNNKLVTGPLWRLLESGIHILDMNRHYQKMSLLFFDLSVDAKEFMLGNVIFFENVELSKDVFIIRLFYHQIFWMNQLSNT